MAQGFLVGVHARTYQLDQTAAELAKFIAMTPEPKALEDAGEIAGIAPVGVLGSMDRSFVGERFIFVGYGVTDAQRQTGNGTRRTVDGVITSIDENFIHYGDGTSGTCQGDSGGPTFLTFADGVEKVGHDVKYDAIVLARHGVVVGGPGFDTMLASYLIDSTRAPHATRLRESSPCPSRAGRRATGRIPTSPSCTRSTRPRASSSSRWS